MKKLFVSALVVFGSLFSSDAVANNVSETVVTIESSDDNGKLKIIKRRKLEKFFGSENFEQDGSKLNYVNKFREGIGSTQVDFYKDKDTDEIVLVFRTAGKDKVVRTGDYI